MFYQTNDFNNPSYTVTSHNQPSNTWGGLDFTSSQDNGGFYDIYGYGLYKVTNSESSSYFYIDYRDYRIGRDDYSPIAHDIDINIKYNASTNSFSYNNHDGTTNYYNISNGSLLLFWEIKEAGTPLTNSFPNFWSNSLVLFPSINNNVQLAWGPHPTFNATNYKVYRAISEEPHNPYSLTYTLIATTNSSTYQYLDQAISLNGTGIYVYYHVKAYRTSPSPNYSSATNYVSTEAEDLFKEINTTQEEVKEFNLAQNYPNPFNPATKISYSIPEAGEVSIKIYSVVGEMITNLVNENQEAGTYEVEFNASSLTSGIYFYRLSAGNFSETKKLILLK